ncbi:MAG: FecR domain-containing protein [Betaproteobacteria bacterium]|nr:FecR domain-containing protein [Betaproteobacteria bacterium]
MNAEFTVLRRRYHSPMQLWRYFGVLVGWAAACAAPAQVGIVRTLEGQVTVSSAKQECAPRHGLDLEEGDAVRTGAKAWAMLNMLDGSRITVRPDSEVRIDTYRYVDAGDAVQNRAVLTLVRGAVRVAAGRIATGRSAGFSVRTSDASIQLRGADHDIAFVESKFATRGDAAVGTYAKTHAGEAVLQNSHGEVAVRGGQVAHAEPAAASRTPPRVIKSEPYFYHWLDFIDRRAAAVVEKLNTAVPQPVADHVMSRIE